MKNKISLALVFFIILSLAPSQAEAQFWKKWFHKEEERSRPRKQPVKDLAPVNKAKPKKKSHTVEYPASVMKSRYRIDVLVPIYLDELVKNNKAVYKDRIPEKALPGLNFYEGIKLAADTLTRLGYGVDVFIHDVTDPGLTPEALVKGNILKDADLIVGALSSAQLPLIAKYARENQINFISALSPSDADIADNPYFTLLQPTLQTHCERIRSTAFKKHGEHNVSMLYRMNVSVDSLAYVYMLEGNKNSFKKLSIRNRPQRQQLLKLFDSTETNVVLMPILDNAYAEDILKQLYEWFPEYSFEVYGMPSWKSMSSLRKPEAYPNLTVSFTEPFYFDLSTAAGQALGTNYYKEFSGKPGEMVFRGYETLFWYSYLLKRYGTIYNPKQGDNGGALFTRFEVKTKWDEDEDLLYNENQHLYLYKYQSGSYIIEQ